MLSLCSVCVSVSTCHLLRTKLGLIMWESAVGHGWRSKPLFGRDLPLQRASTLDPLITPKRALRISGQWTLVSPQVWLKHASSIGLDPYKNSWKWEMTIISTLQKKFSTHLMFPKTLVSSTLVCSTPCSRIVNQSSCDYCSDLAPLSDPRPPGLSFHSSFLHLFSPSSSSKLSSPDYHIRCV